MTAERSGTGTATYHPPVFTGGERDIFSLANPGGPAGLGRSRRPARYVVNKITDDFYYWRVELYDTMGGMNLQRERFMEAHDRLAISTLDSRFKGHLFLPQLTTNATTPDPGGNLRCSWTNLFSRLAIGIGNTTDSCLFTESSETSPIIEAQVYNPAGTDEILSMTPIVIGGVTQAQRLAVGINGVGTEILSAVDPPGAIAGTMHVNTAETWGIIQTPINNQTLLIYAANTIYTLAGTAAIGDAPTSATPGVPSGGYALGMLSLGGAPVRAYWVWPFDNNDAGPLQFGTERRSRIVSTNLQGTDVQPYEPLNNALPNLKFCMVIRSGIVATDGKTVYWSNGRVHKNLHIFVDREQDSDKEFRCRGFWAVGDELYAEVNWIASTGSTDNTIRWVEWYDWDLDTWHVVSGTTTLSTTGVQGVPGVNGLPYSEQTGFAHIYSDGSWRRIYLPPAGLNPFTQRKTNGGTATTGLTYEASGSATWPAFQIPGLEGWAMSVRRISGNPQIDIGGGTPTTNPKVNVSVGGVSADFIYESVASPNQWKQGRQEFGFWQNEHFVYELQPVITLTQQAGGTDPTRTTPQASPIIIEGVASRPRFEAGSAPMDYTR